MRRRQPYDQGLPHGIGLHLPLPGRWPGWPQSLFGQWRVDPIGEAHGWREAHRGWRREHLMRIGYDDAEYRRPELAWSQRNFVHVQTLVHDRYLYDPVARRYTVDRYLDDLQERFGGVDSVLLWWAYPNIGIDDRNQVDLLQDLPGGIDGLQGLVADFHRREVRVFLPTMPWDHGTRPAAEDATDAIVRLAARVDADGINGDTYASMPRLFHEAAARHGHPLVLQPEVSTAVEESLRWNLQSWGKASTEIIPAVAKLKWLEPRHMVNVENRWARDRTDDFHYIFFNGIGYVAWENVWGIWNGFTARDGETLRRIATIYRQHAGHFVSADWAPYADTLQHNVFASLFPAPAGALWTVVNRNEFAVEGEQLRVPHRPGRRYVDLWNGQPVLARVDGDSDILSFGLEPRGLGCVLGQDEGEVPGTVRAPLSDYPASWSPLPQRRVADLEAGAPDTTGMVPIPAADYTFAVTGVEIEGATWAGLDVQYPWEPCARRSHRHRLAIPAFQIDRCLVTNDQYRSFLAASGYRPADGHHFLRHWVDGAPAAGTGRQPVTWVSIEDARAYAAWSGKRLPREWEWQYAAQGLDERAYPWGDDWREDAAPPPCRARTCPALPDVGSYPAGASPFGVLDLVGLVWQWTDEYVDDHTRAAVLRGGSAYAPGASHWYFPAARRLDQHGKYLLMAPGLDRSAMIGFRCAA